MLKKIRNIMSKDKKEDIKDQDTDVLENEGQDAADTSDEERELTPEERIAELEAELGESKDKYLRVFAEFENFRKRSMKERLDLMKTAAQDTIKELLPVLDDFDRAKSVAEDDSTDEEFSEGIKLVYEKLHKSLERKGLKAMESTGETFDPELHEGITEIPAPTEEMKGRVIDTIEKGYLLNDKIIRYAKVVIGK